MKNTKYIYLILLISIFVLSFTNNFFNETKVVNKNEYLSRNTSLANDRFTYYAPGYGGSGTVTASGLSTSNFQTNEMGWYTYNGRVVLAAGFYNCDKLGVICVPLNSIVSLTIAGKTYEGIVIDKCGACSNAGDNRIDIFTSGVPPAISWPSDFGSWSSTGESGVIDPSVQGGGYTVSQVTYTTSYSGDIHQGYLYLRLSFRDYTGETDADKLDENMTKQIKEIYTRAFQMANSQSSSTGGVNGPGLSAADSTGFKQRLQAPTQTGEGNKYYFTNYNRSYAGGFLGQCTWYAYGRANEILENAGSSLKWDIASDAGTWYDKNLANGSAGFKSSNDYRQPKVGAIISWKKQGAPGHVAVVEAVNSDGTVTISEANVTTAKSASNPHGWQRVNLSLGEINRRFTSYTFSGYIYMLD